MGEMTESLDRLMGERPGYYVFNGAANALTGDNALTVKPRFLFIQGWNEWHEGSQIEPSTLDSDPYLYLQILSQRLKRPWQPPQMPPQEHVDALRRPYLPY